MCRLSSACRPLSLCLAADRVVLIAATSLSQQKGQMSGSNQRRVSRRSCRAAAKCSDLHRSSLVALSGTHSAGSRFQSDSEAAFLPFGHQLGHPRSRVRAGNVAVPGLTSAKFWSRRPHVFIGRFGEKLCMGTACSAKGAANG
jgi:hypothetical protein